MHLAYLNRTRSTSPDRARRDLMKFGVGGAMFAAAAGLAGCATAREAAGSSAPQSGLVIPPSAKATPGFNGSGPMDMSTGEDWIDTFFTGGAAEIVHYYADEFVFEDITLYQAIQTKEDLYRAFLPFNDAGPDAPTGVHQFDVIRYDGGSAQGAVTDFRDKAPDGYTQAEWDDWTRDAKLGRGYERDEWGVMQWIWKAKHNADFLGLPAAGKTTHCRGTTFHSYRNRKIVREYTHWEFRSVAIQLGAAEPQLRFWDADFKMPGS